MHWPILWCKEREGKREADVRDYWTRNSEPKNVQMFFELGWKYYGPNPFGANYCWWRWGSY